MIGNEAFRTAFQEFDGQYCQGPNDNGHETVEQVRSRTRSSSTLADKHIGTIDADGVALAAIQGLHEIVQEKNAEISSLESRIEALEVLIDKLVESQEGGE